jgi:hypothetical protein
VVVAGCTDVGVDATADDVVVDAAAAAVAE